VYATLKQDQAKARARWWGWLHRCHIGWLFAFFASLPIFAWGQIQRCSCFAPFRIAGDQIGTTFGAKDRTIELLRLTVPTRLHAVVPSTNTSA
jgi:hypothetical protein